MTGVRAACSFSRARRLDGPHAFASVFAYKCWANGEWFQVYARPNTVARARLGVTVSKRVMKTAVARNTCKRLVRECFRAMCAELPEFDFVVRPRAAFENTVLARREVNELLRRAAGQCRGRQLAITAR